MNLLRDKALDFLLSTSGPALDFLVSTLGQSTVDSWRKNSDVDSDLLNLREALSRAQLLIERSECWRLPKYNPIDERLSQLKDSVYEAESIVNEFEHQRLKNEVEKSFPGINFLRNWMRDFPTTVKRVLDRLNNVYNELKEICDRRGIPENPNKFSENARPTTSPFLDKFNVYCGRDKELNEVIHLMGVPSSESRGRKRARTARAFNFVIGESSRRMDNRQNVSVLSIVGMGGMGKTTLAQMACNHKSVKSHFDLIMWVCVSEDSGSVRLTKEIIQSSATKIDHNVTNLHNLQETLQGILNSKRFLLVLDDVWSKDWQRVLAPMEVASKGSVVLVTTRSPEFVELPGMSIDSRGVINLEGLEEHIYWDFFKSCAFGSVAESNNFNRKSLEDIGMEICVKLKGSPLAAKTIGGLLRTNLDVGHWKNIKDSEMWRLQKNEDDILPVLQLSYQYLPSHLKKCFSICSLYPKDYKFTQSELTEFWIMQGLIKPLGNFQQLSDLAMGYILELKRRCFFQDAHNRKEAYVIHDLMHDVCQSITKDECFCLDNGHSEQKVVSPNIRHVSEFRKKLKPEEQNKLCKNKKLLSLKVAYASSCCMTAMTNWCNELTNIQSLSLARCKIKMLPKNIGNLKHLQFLDISGTKVETLPESFCSLYILQYLNMNNCMFIRSFPQNIGNLKHLQFLDISGTNVETLPESFCSLYILQYLNMNNCHNIKSFPEGFNNLVNLLLFNLPLGKVHLVGHFERICKLIPTDILIHDLTVDMNHMTIDNLNLVCIVRGSLTICGLENVPDKEAVEKVQLHRKPLINRLKLNWYNSGINEHQDEVVLHGLCPHPNLKELGITSYRGRNLSPGWLKEDFLPNLTEVIIEHCNNASTISHLPRFITKLEIANCEQLESLPGELFGGFESLEWLKIYSCPKIKSSNAMVLPPSVKALELASCGELEKSISSCLQNLTSLETLTIHGCQSLVSIRPVEVEGNLKSLTKLVVKNCSKLRSLGGYQFLASVKMVIIEKCLVLVETGGLDVLGKMPPESEVRNAIKESMLSL